MFLKNPYLKKLLIFSGNGTFLYFGKGIFRALAYLELESYLGPKVYPGCYQSIYDEAFCKKSTSRICQPTGIHKVFETNSSFYVKKRLLRRSLISVFQEFFASVNKMFNLAWRRGTGLSFYEV